MNLAALKYRNILKDNESPIQKIIYSKAPDYDGHNYFALLKENLDSSSDELCLYASNGGSGTCFHSKFNAYNKAISEALEIWAYYEVKKNKLLFEKLGFTIDPTSSGMACFPGLVAKNSRTYAFNEAVERWSIVAWWEGKLEVRKHYLSDHNLLIVELVTPWKNLSTVILKSKSLNTQKPIYAFATSCNLNLSIEKAKVELFRNSRVVDQYYSSGIKIELKSLMEKRLIYFSTNEGENIFLNKVNQAFKQKSANDLIAYNEPKRIPRLLIDSKITGPWDRYAYVWRCLFEPVSLSYLDDRVVDYFYF
jgi:hypothetical protein